jgi:UDP-glucose 4-epimerase
MRVLVTGGAGYIGSVVTAQLLAAGHDVVVVDDLSTGHADAVPSGADFHELSITEVAPLLAQTQIDAVIHFAAKSLVGESSENPSLYWHGNVIGTVALLDAMRAAGVSRIVFSSSAATYGQPEEQPIREGAPTRPTSPYGSTKLAIDLALTDYARSYGMAPVSLRYFNVAGALHLPDGSSFGERHTRETHLIPRALRAARGEGQVMSLFGTDYPTVDGTAVRDYIHVVDLADAHLRAIEAATEGTHHVINLGSGSGHSVREVLTAIEQVTGSTVPVVEAERRAGDPAVLIASNDRAIALLGWRPQRDLAAMIEDAWLFEKSRNAL